jgi:glycosyltransferase involved in cell wall biosynthesis
MKILQTISSMGLSAGGPTSCTYNLLKGLQEQGLEADLLTYDVNNADDKLISISSDFMKIISSPKETRFGYKREFKDWLVNNPNYELYHANGLWQYPAHATVQMAVRNHKPLIISTHGMLYPEGLKKSKWIKRISLFLYQRNDLNKATALHATSLQELKYMRDFGLKQPIAIIPNAIDTFNLGIPNFNPKMGRRKVGFMGRINPIKNIESLIKGWAMASSVTYEHELVIIGEGDPIYKRTLVELAEKLGLTNISYTGFVSGVEQDEILNDLSFLVLPSLSENFGMVIPEALWKGVPVIASIGTPWQELETYNCGWWVGHDADSLSLAIIKALEIDENERIYMGKRGNNLVSKKYTIDSVGQKMKLFYDWILGNVEKPEFVNE